MAKPLGVIKGADVHYHLIGGATNSYEEKMFFNNKNNYKAKLFIDLKTNKATLTYWLKNKEIKETHSRNESFILGYKEIAEQYIKKNFKDVVLYSY